MVKKSNLEEDIVKTILDSLKEGEELAKKAKRSQHSKELKSLKNKMSPDNLVWFNSLINPKQYDFLFEWKNYKKHNQLTKVKISYRSMIDWDNYPNRKKVLIKNYPPSLKHFIKNMKKTYRYRITISKKRETIIDTILKKKQK